MMRRSSFANIAKAITNLMDQDTQEMVQLASSSGGLEKNDDIVIVDNESDSASLSPGEIHLRAYHKSIGLALNASEEEPMTLVTSQTISGGTSVCGARDVCLTFGAVELPQLLQEEQGLPVGMDSCSSVIAGKEHCFISQYRALNFTDPLYRRSRTLTLGTYGELMQEHVLSSNPVGVGGGSSTTYALSSSVEIPRGVVPQLLLKMSLNATVSAAVMRTFYTALGDTVLSTDPSCPSGSGPTGISLAQFREFGKVCASVAVPYIQASRGASLRQQLMTSIFECTAKPFQFLSLTSFCIALNMIALSLNPISYNSDEQHASIKFVDRLMENLQGLCHEVLIPYVKTELPLWADPDVDLYWADVNVQKPALEYSKITHEIYDIFSVCVEDEISSAIRRSSSLSGGSSQRGSSITASKSAAAAHSGQQPVSRGRTGSTLTAHPPTEDERGERKNPRSPGVTFVAAAASEPPATSSKVQPLSETREEAEQQAASSHTTPQERLLTMGFPFVRSLEKNYYTDGCDQVRILPLSTLHRIIASMSLPNIQPSDVIRAAKAASLMFPRHPFRRLREAPQQHQNEIRSGKKITSSSSNSTPQQSNLSSGPASSSGGGGSGVNALNVFGSGVNPLSRFVPAGDFFILEYEFLDVLLRLCVVAFPDLVASLSLRGTRKRRDMSNAVVGTGNNIVRRPSVAVTFASDDAAEDETQESNNIGAVTEECGSDGRPSNTDNRTQLSNDGAPQQSHEFLAAFQRLLETYVEGFFMQSTGGVVANKKLVIVSEAEARRASKLGVSSRPSASLNPSTAGGRNLALENEMPSSFALALPDVEDISVVEGTDDGEYSFHRAKDELPGWDSRKETLVSERGGIATAMGHLMFDLTGFYVLFEKRLAVRAHSVLAATLPLGKKTSTVEEAANLATLAEFAIPPITDLFSKQQLAHEVEQHRVIKCCSDGTSGVRVYPYSLTRLRVQYSNDGLHWTSLPPRHMGHGAGVASAATKSSKDVNHVAVKRCRPTCLVPQGIIEGLRIIFHVYARFQEVVKEDVITFAKWKHLCQCLFIVVGSTSRDRLPCLRNPDNRSQPRRPSAWLSTSMVTVNPSNALFSGGLPSSAEHSGTDKDTREEIAPPSATDCTCANCSGNRIAEWKLRSPAYSIFPEFETQAPQSDTPLPPPNNIISPTARSRRVFSPAFNVPCVTAHDISQAFEKHATLRVVTPVLSSSSGVDFSFKILTFEAMVSALLDVIVNHNTTICAEPLDSESTESVMEPRQWWAILTGVISLECLRRQGTIPDIQVFAATDLRALVGNPYLQLIFRRQWSITDSAVSITVDAGDAVAQRNLKLQCDDFLSVGRDVRSVFLFHHGTCVSEVFENPNHQFVDAHLGEVIRSKYLSALVFGASYVSQLRRLLLVELPYTATLERLFKGNFLPFVVNREAVVEFTKPATRGGKQPKINQLCNCAARGSIPPLMASSARRFWLLRDQKSGEAIGCLSNIAGQCATLNWIPAIGSHHSIAASLFLMDKSEVLSAESLQIFRLFVNSEMFNIKAQAADNISYDDYARAWLRAERTLRSQLEQANLILDPVFP